MNGSPTLPSYIIKEVPEITTTEMALGSVTIKTFGLDLQWLKQKIPFNPRSYHQYHHSPSSSASCTLRCRANLGNRISNVLYNADNDKAG